MSKRHESPTGGDPRFGAPDPKKPRHHAGLFADDDDDDDDDDLEAMRSLYENESRPRGGMAAQQHLPPPFYAEPHGKPALAAKFAQAPSAAAPLPPASQLARDAHARASVQPSLSCVDAHQLHGGGYNRFAPRGAAQPRQHDDGGARAGSADQGAHCAVAAPDAYNASPHAPISAAPTPSAAVPPPSAGATPAAARAPPQPSERTERPDDALNSPANGDRSAGERGGDGPASLSGYAPKNFSMPLQPPAGRKPSFQPPTLFSPSQREPPTLPSPEAAQSTPPILRDSSAAAPGGAYATCSKAACEPPPPAAAPRAGCALRLLPACAAQLHERFAQVQQSLAKAALPARSASPSGEQARGPAAPSAPQEAQLQPAGDEEAASAAADAELAGAAPHGLARDAPALQCLRAEPSALPGLRAPAADGKAAREGLQIRMIPSLARSAAPLPRAASCAPPERPAEPPAKGAPLGVLRPLPQPSTSTTPEAGAHPPAPPHKAAAMLPPRAQVANTLGLSAPHQGQLALPLRLGAAAAQPTVPSRGPLPKAAGAGPPPALDGARAGALQQPLGRPVQMAIPTAKSLQPLPLVAPAGALREGAGPAPLRRAPAAVPMEDRLDALEASHKACSAELAQCARAFPLAEFAELAREVDMVSLLQRLDRLGAQLELPALLGRGAFGSAAEEVALEDIGVD